MGFNSGRYDLNMLKVCLIKTLKKIEDIKFVIRKNRGFPCIFTPRFKWLDIANYLAPGFSYDRYLKAYGCTMTKGVFPYEWMDSLDKLQHRSLPPYDAFYSALKGTNIELKDYMHATEVWRQLGMQTFKDYLEWYNNRDVEPFVQAVEKQRQFYAERGLDLFKDGISVPGLTLKYLFATIPKDIYFSLYGAELKEVHDAIQHNLVGGPSIIFHRYQEGGVTQIRSHEYPDPKICKKIVGYDANALYLYALMQPMPTGRLIRRQASRGFRPERSQRYGHMAWEWMAWLMTCNPKLQIQHQFNRGEKKIGPKKIPVDGFDAGSGTVFQFQGCFWHGHGCKLDQNREPQLSQKKQG